MLLCLMWHFYRFVFLHKEDGRRFEIKWSITETEHKRYLGLLWSIIIRNEGYVEIVFNLN